MNKMKEEKGRPHPLEPTQCHASRASFPVLLALQSSICVFLCMHTHGHVYVPVEVKGEQQVSFLGF